MGGFRVSRVAVVGLGYVGAVSAAGLVKLGHEVVGVDVSSRKLEAIQAGESPVSEPGLDELLKEAVASGRLTTTMSLTSEQYATLDVVLVSVGTPSRRDGSPDLRAVLRVAEDLGRTSRGIPDEDLPMVVLRSTVTPGTTHGPFAQALAAGRGWTYPAGRLGYNPEFLREGTGVADFFNPPKTVLGTSGGVAVPEMTSLYAGVPGTVFVVATETAEFSKYIDNSFHAVKITFANEIARIGSTFGIPLEESFAIFLQDTKLNVSQAYLRPGFAFGGSCLPKDLRALGAFAAERDVKAPLLASALVSNDAYIDEVRALIKRPSTKRMLLVGLAFKQDTDDLRESPLLAVAEYAIGRGVEVVIVDPDIRAEAVHGQNLLAALEGNHRILDLLQTEPGDLGAFDLVVAAKNPPDFGWSFSTSLLVDATLKGAGEALVRDADRVVKSYEIAGQLLDPRDLR